MPPTELRLHPIHSWRLSGLGRLAAQGRRAVQAPALVDALNYATYEHFVSKLDWVLKIARQQSDFVFAIFCLRLENLAELDTALGSGRAAELLDSFAERLREPLVEADVGTRPDPETIWLLLPNADHKRLQKLHEAVQRLTDQASQDEGIGPCWRTVDVAVASRDAAKETHDSLLSRLRASLAPEDRGVARVSTPKAQKKRTAPTATQEPAAPRAPQVTPRPVADAPRRHSHRIAPRVS
jgi:GGDEF domain-containing protein